MTDYRSFYVNQATSDPTRTLTLRAKWVAENNRRFALLQTVIRKSVVDNDGFGLLEQNRGIETLEPLPVAAPRAWSYRWSQEKVQAFMDWLKQMEEKSVLEIVHRPGTNRPQGEPWTDIYVRSAYQKGLSSAMAEVRKNGLELGNLLGMSEADLPPSFMPTGRVISAIMAQPFHADRLALAYTRTFDELKGVTATMDQQISRELTKGIAQGLNPRQIGKNIADRIEKIGATRGRLIARTETINVHAQASLNECYSIEQSTGEVILVQWSATLDSRTRDTHMDRNRKVYTKEEAYALIGEPNCRCALIPYIPSIQGVPEKASEQAMVICKHEWEKGQELDKEAEKKSVKKTEKKEPKPEEPKPEEPKPEEPKPKKAKPKEKPPSERLYVDKVKSGFEDSMAAVQRLNNQLGIDRSRYTHGMLEAESALLDQVKNKFVLTRNNRDIAAAFSYEFIESEKVLFVSHLGSIGNVKGAGTEAMRRMVAAALRKGYGMSFESTPDAMDFYKRLGFRNLPDIPKIFKASPDEVKGIAETLGEPGKVRSN